MNTRKTKLTTIVALGAALLLFAAPAAEISCHRAQAVGDKKMKRPLLGALA